MKWLWVQFMALVVLLSIGVGEETTSYFFDQEGSTDNTFMASNLDQAVVGQPIDGLLCQQTDELSTILYTSNLGALDFSYGFSVENASGTLCAGLEATLSTGSTTLYSGSLVALDATDLVLQTENDEELLLELRLLPGATESGTCQFDTSWFAEQLGTTDFLGFSDTETITHFVSGSGTGGGAGCVPPGDTVDLHLSKAISGVSQGFALSDFSYRVTGNGIDVIVPHNHTTSLPIGIYTIEEIVPEGFVKEDWRIGWYGQCKRGSTFFTTIKIDEGNVDHGTLYCQADNQYRPDHGDNSTQTQSAPPGSGASTSTTESEVITTGPESSTSGRPERIPRASQTSSVSGSTVTETDESVESEAVKVETEVVPEIEPISDESVETPAVEPDVDEPEPEPTPETTETGDEA